MTWLSSETPLTTIMLPPPPLGCGGLSTSQSTQATQATLNHFPPTVYHQEITLHYKYNNKETYIQNYLWQTLIWGSSAESTSFATVSTSATCTAYYMFSVIKDILNTCAEVSYP